MAVYRESQLCPECGEPYKEIHAHSDTSLFVGDDFIGWDKEGHVCIPTPTDKEEGRHYAVLEEETVSKDEKVDKNCENDDCVLSGVCHYPNDGDCKIVRLDFMKLLDAAFVAGRSKTSWDQFLKDHGLR